MKFIPLLSLFLFLAARIVPAADMSERIDDATGMLAKKQGSLSPISPELLHNAHGIVFATVTKGGLGIGGMGGEGIVISHKSGDSPSTWSAPSAFNISGGSFGAQIGFSKIKYIIILNTDAAVHQFSGDGKLKWDATAMGMAGEDKLEESKNTTDLSAQAVIIYRDSGGIFGGATLGGTTVEVKNSINQEAYGKHIYLRDIFGGKVPVPHEAERLYQMLEGK